MNKERFSNAIIVENILNNTKEHITLKSLLDKGFTEEDAVSIITFITDQYTITPDLIFWISKQFSIDLNVVFDFSTPKETFQKFILRKLDSAKLIVNTNLKGCSESTTKRQLLEGEFASYSQINIVVRNLREVTPEEFLSTLFKEIEIQRKSIQDISAYNDNPELLGSLRAYIKISNMLSRFI